MFKNFVFGNRVYHILQPFFAPDDDLGIGPITDIDAMNDDKDDDKDDDKKDDDKEDKPDSDTDDDTDDGDKDKEDDTDDDKDEKEDDDKEDDEEEEESDEEKALVTSSWTDIKKAYPDFGKKFPDVKSALFREQRYSEVVGTPEDAEAAVEKASVLDAMSDDLIGKGDPTALLDQIEKSDKESFKKVSMAILPYLQAKDKDLYYAVAGIPIKQLLRAVHAEGKGKTTDLGRAALLIHNWFFDNYDVDKEIPGERRVENTKSAKEKELEDRLNQINTREENDYNKSMDDSYIKKMTSHIKEGLDKDDRLNDYTKNKLVEDILKDIRKQLGADSRYTGQLKSLYKQAKASGFTNDSKSRMINTALVRARALVPAVRQRLVAEALGKKLKAKVEDKETKRASSNGNNPNKERRGSSDRQQPKKALTDIDILRAP